MCPDLSLIMHLNAPGQLHVHVVQYTVYMYAKKTDLQTDADKLIHVDTDRCR